MVTLSLHVGPPMGFLILFLLNSHWCLKAYHHSDSAVVLSSFLLSPSSVLPLSLLQCAHSGDVIEAPSIMNTFRNIQTIRRFHRRPSISLRLCEKGGNKMWHVVMGEKVKLQIAQTIKQSGPSVRRKCDKNLTPKHKARGAHHAMSNRYRGLPRHRISWR